MHDAAITAWGIKGYYDYIRPISSLRAMADRGQSSDPDGESYHVDGIPLRPGYIELVDAGDALAGDDGEHVGKIKFLAWLGPDAIDDPDVDVAGVDWMLAENWWPYQRPTFVTPPFAGYVSGHSTYSRAAAEVLTALTEDEFLSGRHERLRDRGQRVPGVRGRSVGGHDPAVGDLPRRLGPMQPVAHLGRHPPAR